MWRLQNVMLLLHVASSTSLPSGPYATTSATVSYDVMDGSNSKIDVVYPANASKGQVFPLIAYAHGLSDQGLASYPDMIPALASWGYVVTAHLACRYGCLNCESLDDDPPCWGYYYQEQLKVIDWARSSAASSFPLNLSAGVAVCGHSMGGQATLFSAAYNASSHNIKAAAMHHAFTNSYPTISSIPFIAFTGTADDVAPPAMADKIYSAATSKDRGLVNKVDADHHEPTSNYNPNLAVYTAAFFKLHVDGVTSENGVNFEELVYGKGSDSLCGGGDGDMKECELN